MKNLFRIELENGDRFKPKYFIDDNILQDLWLPWKDAVIVKLLGKMIGFVTMHDRLKSIWKLAGRGISQSLFLFWRLILAFLKLKCCYRGC